MTQDNRELLKLLKAAVEAAAPDLRGQMAMPRRAKVVAVKPAGGTYTCSVQMVLNDGRPDPQAPVIPDVEIPTLWAGPDRGLVCPPTVGEYCDVNFYDGDPNCPFITNFRPSSAPEAGLNELMIQYAPGIRLGFRADGAFIIEAPNEKVEIKECAELTAGQTVKIKAPLIQFEGRVEITGGIFTKAGTGGSGMEVTGDITIKKGGLQSEKSLETGADVRAAGSVSAGGDIMAAGKSDNHHSH